MGFIVETTVTFEDEMYYSLNDIAKLTDLPKDLIRQELEKRHVKHQIMLSTIRVFKGKDIEPIFYKLVEDGRQKTTQRQTYPFLDSNQDYTMNDILQQLGMSKMMFERIYLGVNSLPYTYTYYSQTYYRGLAVNKITNQINQSILPIKPIEVESRIYTKAEIVSALSTTINTFNKVYIRVYGLQPIERKKHQGYKGYVMYDGAQVNAITKDVLRYYGRVLS